MKQPINGRWTRVPSSFVALLNSWGAIEVMGSRSRYLRTPEWVLYGKGRGVVPFCFHYQVYASGASVSVPHSKLDIVLNVWVWIMSKQTMSHEGTCRNAAKQKTKTSSILVVGT